MLVVGVCVCNMNVNGVKVIGGNGSDVNVKGMLVV